jgi:hypothetical protein
MVVFQRLAGMENELPHTGHTLSDGSTIKGSLLKTFDGVDFYPFDFVRVYRDDHLVNLFTEKALGMPLL